MMTQTNQPSKVKIFALNVLSGFDDLARPEIQNVVMEKIWNYVRNYAQKVILKKPDEEIQVKLFNIYKVFKEHFDDIDMAIELKKGEELGSPQVPNLGKIAEVRALSNMNDKKAYQLIKDLGL